MTVTENEGAVVAPAATGWKPESIPDARGWQGAAKDDCVTVWFFGKKTKETVSPTEALTELGEKESPLLPTWTWISAADAEVAAAMAARAAEARVKRILMIFFSRWIVC